MKLFHISDLHIGKQLHAYSLADEQRDALCQIVLRAQEYRPDAMLIAGDIYDKSAPSGEAYQIFDEFLNRISEVKPSIPVFIIAGNHDNALRLRYASSFLKKHQIYIETAVPMKEEEHIKKYILEDADGKVNFYLLPFTKPHSVRFLFEQEEAMDYNSAFQALLRREEIDYSQRNVLVAHQFFVAGERMPQICDSEINRVTVGGVDCIDIECVKKFDYVALGHLHGPQSVGLEHIRYSGSPLKYSLSEEGHQKAITCVTLGEKGNENIYESIPLTPMRDLKSVRGTLEQVMKAAGDQIVDDYVRITLTNEDCYRPRDVLEQRYARILEILIDNGRIKSRLQEPEEDDFMSSPFLAFSAFYQEMSGRPMNEEESAIIEEILQTLKEKSE